MKKQDLVILLENKRKNTKRISAWKNGVYQYAFDFIDNIESDDIPASKDLRYTLLNGASNWNQFSWGGCSLIYDGDIAMRLCTASELKRTDNGRLKPCKNNEWLDVQAWGLTQAYLLLLNLVRAYEKTRLEDA